MKYSMLLLLLCAFIGQTNAQIDTADYSVGMSVASRLQGQGVSKLDYESFMKGLKDYLSGQETIITKRYSDSLNYHYFQKQKTEMIEELKKEGVEFLAKNGAREEVTTTASGLQYEVIKAGDGPKPTANSTVKVHYEGRLLNGDLFDSSVERGQPISFPLNRVIPGWTEGLQLMSEGEKYRLYVPYDLGYGARGAGGAIPPYATLIFDVELLEVKN